MTSDDIRFLARSKGLREVSDNLLKTEYGTEISKLPTKEVDAATLEAIFLKKLVERFFFLIRQAQGNMRDLLKEYCSRFEAENIKRVIRAKHGGQIMEESNLIPLPREYTLVNFPALLNAKDVEEVVALLHETSYRPLVESLQPYRETGSTMVLEAGLDGIYLGKVWKIVGKVSGGNGLKNLVGEEIDLKNILIAFSLKARGLPSSLIEKMLIPLFHRVPKERLHSLVQSRLEDAPGIVTTPRYRELISGAVNLARGGSAVLLERIFLKQLYEDASKALETYFLNVGYVIAYLLLCEREARNLVTIATGKQLSMGEEEISQNLFEI